MHTGRAFLLEKPRARRIRIRDARGANSSLYQRRDDETGRFPAGDRRGIDVSFHRSGKSYVRAIDVLLNVVFEKTDSDERKNQIRSNFDGRRWPTIKMLKLKRLLLRDWILSRWPALDPDTGQRKALSATEKSD